jgi:hypothetical protein
MKSRTSLERTLLLFALGSILGMAISACASIGVSIGSSMADIDRSALNHPAMDLNTRLTPAPTTLLTGLESPSQGSSSACSVCAH